MKTTADAIQKSQLETIGFEWVEYLQHGVESALDRNRLSFFCKDKKFSWEREVRMILYYSACFHQNGIEFNGAPIIKRLIEIFDETVALKKYEEFLSLCRIETNPLRNPLRQTIRMNLKNLFSEIVLSPGMSEKDEEQVRSLVSLGKLNATVRHAVSLS